MQPGIVNCTSSRRVAITGMGIIAPGAIGKEQLWNLISQGRSAIATLSRFDPKTLPCTIGGEVDGFNPLDHMKRKTSHRIDRAAQFAVGAAHMAWQDAGLDATLEDLSRVGVFEGTSLGPLVSTFESHKTYLQSGCQYANPMLLMSSMMGGGSGFIALELGAHGPSLTFADGSVSSAYAIGHGYRCIKSGGIDVAIVGGAEAPLSEEVLATFSCARLLSTCNSSPCEAMKPYDRERDGFVLGEGAAFLILEESAHAVTRGARVYGEIIGFGETTDAYHPTSPDPQGTWATRAMENALAEGNVRPEEVQYLNAHGTATKANDIVETSAIKRAFGEHPEHLSISSTKPFTGHLLGACGALEAATTLLAMTHSFVPPTLNLSTPDEGCNLEYEPRSGRRKFVNVAMSNNYSFGGRNSSLLFKRVLDV